jgi:hypothetical protein
VLWARSCGVQVMWAWHRTFQIALNVSASLRRVNGIPPLSSPQLSVRSPSDTGIRRLCRTQMAARVAAGDPHHAAVRGFQLRNTFDDTSADGPMAKFRVHPEESRDGVAGVGQRGALALATWRRAGCCARCRWERRVSRTRGAGRRRLRRWCETTRMNDEQLAVAPIERAHRYRSTQGRQAKP